MTELGMNARFSGAIAAGQAATGPSLSLKAAWALLPAFLVLLAAGPALAWNYYMEGLCQPVRWPDCTAQIPFYIDAGEIDEIESDGEHQAIADAFRAWNEIPCASIELTVAGYKPNLVAEANEKGPNENVVVFVKEGWSIDPTKQSYIALTTLSYDPKSCGIIDADIEVNAQHFDFSLCGPGDEDSDRQDLRYVILHETGHVFGLNHSNDALAIMFVQDSKCTDLPGIKLTPDDEEGLCFCYEDPRFQEGCLPDSASEPGPIETTQDAIDGDGSGQNDDGGKKAADCCCRMGGRTAVPAGCWLLLAFLAVLLRVLARLGKGRV